MLRPDEISVKTESDKWHQWLLNRRFGGDVDRMRRNMQFLRQIAAKIVENAAVSPGDVLLDVGTGDGLVAFESLDAIGSTGKIIFSDISSDLVDYCRNIVKEAGF